MLEETPAQQDDVHLYRWCAALLRVGNSVGIALLVFGLALSILHPADVRHHSHSLAAAWRILLSGAPSGVLETGLQAVILTPVLIPVTVLAYATMHRKRSLLLPSLLILLGLVVSVWIGVQR